MKKFNSTFSIFAKLIIAVFVLTACEDPRYFQSDEKVQQFRSKLNSYKEEFAKIDTSKLGEIYRTIGSSVDTLEVIAVQNNWVLEKEEAEFFSNYKALSEPAFQLSEKATILESDLLYSEKQLATLQTDIHNKALPADSIIVYLKHEEKALETIGKSAHNMAEGHKVLVERFKVLHPQFNYYVNRVNERN